MALRILVLCTGNSCRSQMAEGFLKQFLPSAAIESAGTAPASALHPMAIRVMAEKGIDLTPHTPKNVDGFLTRSFDYVITVCDAAEESCPAFSGTVAHRLHMGFEDPAKVRGDEEQRLAAFRRIRDEIETTFRKWAEGKSQLTTTDLSGRRTGEV